MFGSVGPLEIVALVVIALLVFGPDKLPSVARDAAGMLRQLREMARGARSQLKSELGPEFADFDLDSLNPRTFVRKNLFDDDDDAPAAPSSNSGATRAPAAPSSNSGATRAPAAPAPPLRQDERAPYDPDAT